VWERRDIQPKDNEPTEARRRSNFAQCEFKWGLAQGQQRDPKCWMRAALSTHSERNHPLDNLMKIDLCLQNLLSLIRLNWILSNSIFYIIFFYPSPTPNPRNPFFADYRPRFFFLV
jgi:hypothetical protein